MPNTEMIATDVHNTRDPLTRRTVERIMSSSTTTPAEGVWRLVTGVGTFWDTLEIIELDDADDPHDGETRHSTHVSGMGIDDEVAFRVEDLSSTEDFCSHRDDQNTLPSVMDALGEVGQRYQYWDYGAPRLLDRMGAYRHGTRSRRACMLGGM